MYVANKNEEVEGALASYYAREFVFNEVQVFRIPANSYFFN